MAGKRSQVPVFIYKTNRAQVGTGIYPMVACFVALGVHVQYEISVFQQSGIFFEAVTGAVPCDGSCRRRLGHTDDFSEKRRNNQYSVRQIVDAALAFKK